VIGAQNHHAAGDNGGLRVVNVQCAAIGYQLHQLGAGVIVADGDAGRNKPKPLLRKNETFYLGRVFKINKPLINAGLKPGANKITAWKTVGILNTRPSA
jgi:hypothetical protein